jgi:hypothetical protein
MQLISDNSMKGPRKKAAESRKETAGRPGQTKRQLNADN